MLDIVELGIQHHGVGQICANGLEDCHSPGIVLRHQTLDHLQLLGGRQLRVQLDARSRGQLDHRILGEILAAHADVGGPLVGHGVLTQVNRRKGQFVDPAQHILVLVHIAHSLRGTHGNTHDVAHAQAHSPCQGGHVAVIGHHNGHIADLLGGPVIDGLHLVPVGTGHLDEQGGHHGSVADEGAGGGHADGIHPGHLGSGGLKGLYDVAEVVVGILLELGEPDHFLGVDALPVNNGGNLPVRAARVKADAAAIHMAAHGLRHLIGSGAGFQRQIQDLQVPLIELVDKSEIKLALTLGGVSLLQPLRQFAAATDGNPEAAGRPEQELDIALYIPVIRLGHFRSAVDAGMMHGNTALVTLYRNGNGLLGVLQIGRAPNTEGNKLRIQFRGMLHLIFDA